MKILCTICGRGGSKGIKNKNLTKIKGKPLIYYSIKQAIKSKLFDEIVVSTDVHKIQKIAQRYGASSWFLREKKLASDKAAKLPVIKDSLKRSEKYFNKVFDYVIDLDISSPLRNIEDIRRAFKKFLKNNNDNLFSVYEAKKNPYFNMVEMKNNKILLSKNTKKFYTSRQTSPKVFSLNASIYIWKRERLLKSKTLIGKKTGIYEMPQERSIDIDSNLDLKIVKSLIKKI
tara:strand:+ start:838 stop:1527 length:690 start_codon:yes stop_codon:yes gene_type:complete